MDAKLKAQAEEMAKELATQAGTLDELNTLFRGLMKTALQSMLDSEMDVHLGRTEATPALAAARDDSPQTRPAAGTPRNRRNGYSRKTVQGEMGEIPLDIPRDRDGSFDPLLIGKYQRRLPGFDDKVLALYAKGLSTRDIQDLVGQLYGVEVSPDLISHIVKDLDGELAIWKARPLDPVWPVVYFDGIVVHVRGDDGRVSPHTMYVALGVNLRGYKELLGLWLAPTEGAKFWLSCLNDLKTRGLADLFVACVDGLSGFAEAIHAAYPQAKVQLCVVHLVRAALKYVSDKDSRAVIKDLQAIYRSATAGEAERQLEAFASKWDGKYPTISKQWRAKWHDIVAMFEFPPEIRRAIYTTNAIESVNSVIRKFTRNRKQYPSGESALKLVYLAINEASRRWTRPIVGWKQALNHFAILFEGRLPLNFRR